MTPEAVEKREFMAYEQMDRTELFKAEEAACLRANGHIVIERSVKTRRRQEILNIPGLDDDWACVRNRHAL